MVRLIMLFVVSLLFISILGSHQKTMADSPIIGDDPHNRRTESGSNNAPEANDSHFVAGSGGHLDQYLFRDDVPNGRLSFDIPITRYYFNSDDEQLEFDNDGFLTPSAREHLTSNQILPETAILRLRVFDVDENADQCPEIDHVYVNDKRIPEIGPQAKLSGADDTWSAVSFEVPIGVLKFPQNKGNNGNKPQEVNNQISIQIDTLGCVADDGHPAWAVEVDWGMIEIPSPIRPIVFAHGWTGDVTAFNNFISFMQQDGIPSVEPVDLLRGIQPIALTSPRLTQAIKKATQEFGVDKVNIFAHSKGGVVSRHALRSLSVAKKTEHLITFGTPHHGVDDWELDWWKCREFEDEEDEKNEENRRLCREAADEMSVDRIRDEFNYQGCTKRWPWSDWEGCTPRHVQQPNVTYRSFIGNIDLVADEETATYPWRANAVPYPTAGNIDHTFNCNTGRTGCHSELIQIEESYCRSITTLEANIKTGTCPNTRSPATTNDSLDTPIPPDEEYQAIIEAEGSLSSGSSANILATVDTGQEVQFNLFSTNELASFTLQDPNDDTVTSSTSGVTYAVSQSDDFGWWYQYRIENPTEGSWQLQISALNDTDYFSNVMAKNGLKLFVKSDRHTYNHNETVTVEAALLNDTTPLLGTTINLVVTRPDDSTLNLTLVDDGSNGDATANDGIYTTQFNSSTNTGHLSLSLEASNGLTTRLAETFIAVTAQTAQIQSVSQEIPRDNNANGLYDELMLNLSLNVLTEGHFEVISTLIDQNGNPVASASYATLREGTDPLSAGSHTIPLTFSGSAIRAHSVDGPYTLTNVIVQDQSNSLLDVDSAENVYVTTAYQVNQFEGSLLTLAGESETPIDNDGNGRYDSLSINLTVDVINSGSYDLNGRLVDPNGDEIAWSSASFTASSSGSYSVQLDFDGTAIGEHRVDGPYTLKDVIVFNTTGSTSEIFDQAYVTQAYSFIAFEGGFYKTFLPATMQQTGSPTSPCTPSPSGESNNIADAITVCSGQTVSGQVSATDQDDVYKILTEANQDITISMSGTGGDADLYLYPPDTTDVTTDPASAGSTSGSSNELIEGTVLVGGYWYIDVHSYSGSTNYNLTVTLSSSGTNTTQTFTISGTTSKIFRSQSKLPE